MDVLRTIVVDMNPTFAFAFAGLCIGTGILLINRRWSRVSEREAQNKYLLSLEELRRKPIKQIDHVPPSRDA